MAFDRRNKKGRGPVLRFGTISDAKTNAIEGEMLDRQSVHSEAPSSAQVPNEMDRYVDWFNLAALAYLIERERKVYYDHLERHQKTLDVTVKVLPKIARSHSRSASAKKRRPPK